MNLINLLSAFVYKEVKTFYHFKFHNVANLLFTFIQLLVFFYLSQLISADYFTFLFCGLLFSRIFHQTVLSYVETLKQEQYHQTIYHLFLIPEHELTIFTIAVVSKFLVFYVEIIFFILIAIILGLKVSMLQTSVMILWTFLVLMCTLWFAILMTALSIIIKKSEVLASFLCSLIDILSGVYFPVDLLPQVLQKISYFLPTTYLISFLRNIVKYNKFDFIKLIYPTITAILFLVISVMCFNYLLRKVLKTGKLLSY